MSTLPPDATAPSRLAGVRMILRYNWPLYAAGIATVAVGTAAATFLHRPLLRAAAAAAAVVAGWLAVASLAASWWVYDRSELYRWTWLPRTLPTIPRGVLVIHSGLDEASMHVTATWPSAEVQSVDVHGGSGATTASLRRARTRVGRATDPCPLEPVEFDAVVALLAAHEIRDADARTNLFVDLHDRLRPGGRLILVEHVRDLANALAYGPAIGHFYPVHEWRRAIDASGMQLRTTERITPFVVLLIAEKPG